MLPPYDVGEPGKDAPGTLNFPTDPRLNFPYGPDGELPKYPYEKIETPNSTYINETCLFDVSKLENNKTYTRLQNGSLTIGFFNEGEDYYLEEERVLKLKSSSATGWNSQWGISPAVEQENPDIFYLNIYKNGFLYIYLSKPCVEFGFELAPNRKGFDHDFYAYFGDWIRDNTKGNAGVYTKSPSGARLFAVKSTKPFRMITLGNHDSPRGAPDPRGMAIANIRYKLAK